MATEFVIPPLCKVNGCEMPSQVYSKVSMNSKKGNQYLKTCLRHTYQDIKPKYNNKGEK